MCVYACVHIKDFLSELLYLSINLFFLCLSYLLLSHFLSFVSVALSLYYIFFIFNSSFSFTPSLFSFCIFLYVRVSLAVSFYISLFLPPPSSLHSPIFLSPPSLLPIVNIFPQPLSLRACVCQCVCVLAKITYQPNTIAR